MKVFPFSIVWLYGSSVEHLTYKVGNGMSDCLISLLFCVYERYFLFWYNVTDISTVGGIEGLLVRIYILNYSCHHFENKVKV